MAKLLIKNATLVNEGKIYESDVLVQGERIEKIAPSITAGAEHQVIDAEGLHLIPGMIDDQVHFREPGFPSKGNIATESRAAVAGGITSIMEMPNVNPQTTNLQALEDKYDRAAKSCVTNHSFYLGATNDNLEEIKRLDPNQACGVKVFMGASTGNMLVDNQDTLAGIFANSPVLIATHCEDSPTISALEAEYRAKYGEDVPMHLHAEIRSREACYKSSSMAVELAKKHDSRLHVLHITTKEELELFKKHKALSGLAKEQVTAEACVHHLFFNRDDYATKGSLIKCNPAVKERADQEAILQAIKDDVIDIIATDHAPHTWDEKQGTYFNAPSGLPLVQHALLSLFEHYHKGILSLETIVQKTSHAVTERYQLKDRGYLREGYFADLALVNLNKPYTANKDNTLYHCGWSPFEGYQFGSTIHTTLVNGAIGYQDGQLLASQIGQRLTFNR